MIKSVTLGCDAEVFLKTLPGQPLPVCGLVGGTKEEPIQLEKLGSGFAVQEDNAALEFNVPPAVKPHVWEANFDSILRLIACDLLPDGIQLDFEMSSCIFNTAYLKIPAMNVFGCEPDLNVYTMRTNPRPKPPVPGFRSAAAHIHLGWKNPTDEERLELVRLCDVFAVLPNLEMENTSEVNRRKLYGKAGAFRWKEYGIEHRVKSNRWVVKDPIGTFYEYQRAVNAYNSGLRVETEDYPRIEAAINEHHVKLANSLWTKYYNKYQASQ